MTDIYLIIPGLYQGNYEGAIDIDQLETFNISAILNCGANNYHTDLDYLKIKLEDSMDGNLFKILPRTLEFIHYYLENNKNIYVHCRQGYSRSPAIIIAYLIKYKNFTFEEALKFMQEKNPKTKPNLGFLLQLERL